MQTMDRHYELALSLILSGTAREVLRLEKEPTAMRETVDECMRCTSGSRHSALRRVGLADCRPARKGRRPIFRRCPRDLFLLGQYHQPGAR